MDKFYYIALNNVLGEFAKWAVIQSPYCCPDKLHHALDAIVEMSFPYFQDGTNRHKMWRCTKEYFSLYAERIKEISEVVAWSKPKVDSQLQTSSYSGLPPDCDCIDLDVLIQNMTRELFDAAARQEEGISKHDSSDGIVSNPDF